MPETSWPLTRNTGLFVTVLGRHLIDEVTDRIAATRCQRHRSSLSLVGLNCSRRAAGTVHVEPQICWRVELSSCAAAVR